MVKRCQTELIHTDKYSVFRICSFSQKVESKSDDRVRLEQRAPIAAAGMSIVKAWKLATVANMYQIDIWNTDHRYSTKTNEVKVTFINLPLAGMILLPDKTVAGKKTSTWKTERNARVSIAINGFSCSDSSLTQTDWMP